MYGFVYIWINNINQKYYLGSHEGSIDDGYIGSGKLFVRAIKKYGIEKFTRYVHYIGFDFRNEEEECLMLLDSANDSRSYNLKNAAFSGSNVAKVEAVAAIP